MTTLPRWGLGGGGAVEPGGSDDGMTITITMSSAQAVQAQMIRNCKPFWQNVSRNDCTVWTVFMGYTNPLCNVLSCVQHQHPRDRQLHCTREGGGFSPRHLRHRGLLERMKAPTRRESNVIAEHALSSTQDSCLSGGGGGCARGWGDDSCAGVRPGVPRPLARPLARALMASRTRARPFILRGTRGSALAPESPALHSAIKRPSGFASQIRCISAAFFNAHGTFLGWPVGSCGAEVWRSAPSSRGARTARARRCRSRAPRNTAL